MLFTTNRRLAWTDRREAPQVYAGLILAKGHERTAKLTGIAHRA